jgi:GT2 family glycosyltransferase
MPPSNRTRAVSITVATVVFNGRNEITRTLDSVLAQDHPDLEVLVIDGQSTDGTPAVVQGYGSAIHQFVSEPDRGVYDAMNKAVEHARGEFILFMNCGDVFASQTALSSLLAQAPSDGEALLFGRWVRQGGLNGDQACQPDLARGVFNHQALAYSRSIHRWHGPYAVVPGLTTADYLFFATLMRTRRVACRVVDAPVAVIDVNGLSAGLQTFSQKQAIDYLCGNIGRARLVAMLALHPVYHRLKKLLTWTR